MSRPDEPVAIVVGAVASGAVLAAPLSEDPGRAVLVLEAGPRVADTSILPTSPMRGPAATAVLIGEVVADAVRRAAP
ncbi:GMC family oxidoreductase N-terminal domain-containing protein [Streptomyces sp. NBC_00631]|uniref:hypothetical protein n=1 Tax=Streptomyces sp. NBC_00631 TaxID=2975793 RepID=UPI0030E19AF1